MRAKTEKVLPKILVLFSNGGIYKQEVRCGKKNCKCARGELHIAYYYFCRHDGKKLSKYYIRKSELAKFSEEVEERIYWRNRCRTALRESKEHRRRFRDQEKLNRELGIKEEPFNGRFPRQVGERIEVLYSDEFQDYLKSISKKLNQKRIS
jgi:hypothetical protein